MDETRITVRINDRDYPLACRAGEEERITALAGRIDAIAKRVPGANNVLGESRLLVMAALILADQLDELERSKAKTKSSASTKAKTGVSDLDGETMDTLAEQIEIIAGRLETLAGKLTAK